MKQYSYKRTEFWCGLPDQRIFGLLYLPDSLDKPPLVVYSHEMGKNHTSGIGYAESLASDGIAVYVYDIRGGSNHSRSEGLMEDMSAFTVADDLNIILKDLICSNLIDPDQIVLLGCSLGGFASAITAMRFPEKITGLILLYPGFVLIEDLHREYDSIDHIPDRFIFNKWFPVGKRFATDVWDFNPYTQIGKYKKPVLILHGEKDPLLPASWSLMTASAYQHPIFHIVRDGQHGFRGKAQNEALVYIRTYSRKCLRCLTESQ